MWIVRRGVGGVVRGRLGGIEVGLRVVGRCR